jgi:hypothetical protein
VKNREFWVWTAVDFGVSVVVGVAAAAVVGGTIAGLVTLGITAAATAPLWLTVGATAGVGIFLGSKVEAWGIPKDAKTAINTWIDDLLERTNP